MALTAFALQQQSSLGVDTYVLKLSSNCDGTGLAAATSDNTAVLLDVSTGLNPVRSLAGHTDIVEDLTFFQANPACLVSCSRDGTARLWDVRASEAARVFTVGSQEVYSCSIGRNDTALACAASEKVHLFDVAAGKRMRVYKDSHTDVVNHVRFHPVDSTKLLSGAEDNLVVVVDTNKTNEEEAILAVIPNEECVRSFTLVGPGRDTLCCASTTEDVRIWGLGADDCGAKKAEFIGLRNHPLLMREESMGYLVEMFYDQFSGQVFLLTGAGSEGDLAMFRVSLTSADPVATFVLQSPPPVENAALQGHSGIVRSALCMPGGVVVTAGEDGFVCAWREQAVTGEQNFVLEPSEYGPAEGKPQGVGSTPY
mmetsp:Transcript_31854/g.49539  ORF Transcript_31854/g.49539 Transcript_31854/m.49539 type:complete len:368 (+) Transcript_31854:29-1132(+)